MKSKSLLLLSVSWVLVIFLQSCDSPFLYQSTTEPKDGMIGFSNPESFKISLETASAVNFILDIEYDPLEVETSGMPFYLILEGKDIGENGTQDFEILVELKDAFGWRGSKSDKNDNYRTISETVLKNIELGTGEYLFKVYSNQEDDRPVFGCYSLTLNLEQFEP